MREFDDPSAAAGAGIDAFTGVVPGDGVDPGIGVILQRVGGRLAVAVPVTGAVVTAGDFLTGAMSGAGAMVGALTEAIGGELTGVLTGAGSTEVGTGGAGVVVVSLSTCGGNGGSCAPGVQAWECISFDRIQGSGPPERIL